MTYSIRTEGGKHNIYLDDARVTDLESIPHEYKLSLIKGFFIQIRGNVILEQDLALQQMNIVGPVIARLKNQTATDTTKSKFSDVEKVIYFLYENYNSRIAELTKAIFPKQQSLTQPDTSEVTNNSTSRTLLRPPPLNTSRNSPTPEELAKYELEKKMKRVPYYTDGNGEIVFLPLAQKRVSRTEANGAIASDADTFGNNGGRQVRAISFSRY